MFSRPRDGLARLRGGHRPRVALASRGRYALEAQVDVDPVEEGTRQSTRVPPDRLRGALAPSPGHPVLTARAGVRRDHELETRGIGGGHPRSVHLDDAALERLAQGVEDRRRELTTLVE